MIVAVAGSILAMEFAFAPPLLVTEAYNTPRIESRMSAMLGSVSVAVMASGGACTVSDLAAEAPPPGVGFTTTIDAVPGTGTSLAGMAAVRDVALTYVVGRSTPFQRITDVG